MIALARKALEIHTQLEGADSSKVANDMIVLAQSLDLFNNKDDDEVLHLFEQAKGIYARVYGASSVNVAVGECKLGKAYHNRAKRARAAKDLDREQANLELALPHLRESARIYGAIGREDLADTIAQFAVGVEKQLRQVVISQAAAAAATKG